ncbi:MAG: glycosyltransferase family 4 protein [Methylocystaceae bacterium]
MKMAIFSDTYLPQINGVTETIINTERELRDQGLEVRLFVPRSGEVSSTNTVFTYPGIKFILYPELEVAVPTKWSMDRKLDDFRPDIIQLMTPFSMGFSGLRYGIRHGIPTLGAYLTDFPALAAQYGVRIMEKPLARYMRWFYSRCDLTLFPSRDIMNRTRARGITNGTLWQAGVDLNQFSPDNYRDDVRKRYLDGDEALILYVGRLASEKEIDVLFAAADILQQRGTKHRLLVVGDGPYRPYLEQMAGKSVVFAGYQTGKELQAIYAAADIFAFPSPNETFGMVVLEAMASGLPVIGVDTGGVSELITNGLNGLTFTHGDSEQLARQLELLIENPRLRHFLGQHAYNYAQRYSWQNSCNELLESCQQVMSDRKVDAEAN